MLSDTDSMQCTTQDEDKNAIILKFFVSCKNVGGLFPRHNNIIFIFFGRQEPSFKISVETSQVIYSFIHLFCYSFHI